MIHKNQLVISRVKIVKPSTKENLKIFDKNSNYFLSFASCSEAFGRGRLRERFFLEKFLIKTRNKTGFASEFVETFKIFVEEMRMSDLDFVINFDRNNNNKLFFSSCRPWLFDH